jgi:uncharacterized protein YwqG
LIIKCKAQYKEAFNMDIVTELKAAGLKYQASVLDSLKKPSIVAKTSSAKEGDFSLGESKIGGLPHLPPDFEWPYYEDEPLAFIAQFNLEEISAYDTEGLLPHEGILYFFFEGRQQVWGFDPSDKGGFRVFHIKCSTSDLEKATPPSGLSTELHPCKLSYNVKPSYPVDENLLVLLDEDSLENFYQIEDDLLDDFENITEICSPLGEKGVHRLLGYPDLLLGEINSVCQMASNGVFCEDSDFNDEENELLAGKEDWILLFQMDTDDNARAMWGDCGMIYFAIKKEDLKREYFNDAWAVFQCL